MASDMSQAPLASPPLSPLAVPVLMGVVFLSLIGFGVVIPLLPFYATVFGASAWQVTSMFAVFAAGQFFGELIWGRLSDRIGRKPVILGTILMAALGYVALAFAPNIWFAIAARAVAGVFSGNISTIQGYIVDVTPQEKLAGRLGLIGSAFGIGFVVGPLLGGVLARPEIGAAGFQPPLLTAAALCLAGGLGAAVFVRESRSRGMAGARRPGPLQALAQTLGDPTLRRLMGGTFLSFAGFSAMWSIFGLWGAAAYGWGPKMIGFVMALTGVAAATSQGLLSGWAVKRIGERPTVLVGLTVTAVFLFLEALGPPMVVAIILMVILVIGHTTSQPATSALISRAAPFGRQGETLGANNASSAAARVLGPVLAGFLFAGVGPWAPFVLAGVLILPAAALIGLGGRPSA